MFLNSGEVIMYFGCFLFSLPFILVLIRKVLFFVGLQYNFLHSHKAGVAFGLLLIYGLIIAYIGQSYKDRICNDVMLSYYEQGINYSELTPSQRINILYASIHMPIDFKKGNDVSKYLPALEKYTYQSKIYKHKSIEEAKEETNQFMKTFTQ
ncbi:hypothetical protein I4R29_002221 [Salmonella enterica]|nr:hypothetical protein [Salmonella enterica]